MNKIIRLMVVGFVAGFIFQVLPDFGSAISRTEDIELTIPDTILQISGYAAPKALVTITENNSTLGTTTADSVGAYSFVLGSQKSGLRTINAYFSDKDGVRSNISTKKISVQPQQTTIVSMFLSPTITRRTPQQTLQGNVVQINGYTATNASVLLSYGLVGSEVATVSNGSGFYEFILNTNDLYEGSYSVFVIADLAGSLSLSENSKSVTFSVISKDPESPNTPDIIVRPNQLPPPIPQSPEDGSVITGDRITITGESVPNAQIVIYQNGVAIGSVFANGQGKWEFEYIATTSPVVLTFEACRNGVCSVLSQSLSLNFIFDEKRICSDRIRFELSDYRFWGIKANEAIQLNVLQSSGDGVLYVQWGNQETEERFDHDAERPTPYEHAYAAGQYNGSIRFEQGDCEITRYFSVDANDHDGVDANFYLMILLILVILPFSYWSYIEGKILMKNEIEKAAKSKL